MDDQRTGLDQQHALRDAGRRPQDAFGEHPDPDGTVRAPVPTVVFACRANGGRSVASRLLMEHYAQGRVVAVSAGTEPGDRIHPEVATVLEHMGLDTSRESPKLLTADTIRAADITITMGCGEKCPYVPGATYRDWPLDDPKGQGDATVRRIVADIDRRVRDLLAELVPGIDLPRSVVTGGGAATT